MILISDRQRQIIDAYFLVMDEAESPEKVTMEMIANRAGIRRQSIYEKHFGSIGEIAEKVHALISEECEAHFKNFFFEDGAAAYQGDFFKFFETEILPILYDKRDWLKILYGTSLNGAWIRYAQKVYLPYIELYINQHEYLPDLSKEFLSQYMTGTIIAVVSSWLTSEKPEPASLFQKQFDRLMHMSMMDMLSN